MAGMYYSYFILVFLVILSGIYLILKDSRLVRGFRLGYAILSVVFYFIIVGTFRIIPFSFLRSGPDQEKQPVRKIEGSAVTLSTLEQSDGSIRVLLHNQEVFCSGRAGMKSQQLPSYLPLLLGDEVNSAMVMGFGTGTVASLLEINGVESIHITEVFPEIIRFSSDIYADLNDDIVTSSHVDITIEDARSYLIRTNAKTDLITTGYALFDYMPDIYTTEFYRLCFNKLSDAGLICQTVPVKGVTTVEFMALIKACSDVFPEVSLWYLSPSQLLMLGSKSGMKKGLCRLQARFARMNVQQGMTSIGIPDLESLLGHLLMDNNQLRKFTGTGSANTDNKPVAEFSRMFIQKPDQELLQLLSGISADYDEFVETDPECSLNSREVIIRSREINEALKKELLLSSGAP
jgi:hypothetical protein